MGCSSDIGMKTVENKQLDKEDELDKEKTNENNKIIKMGPEKENISLDNKTSIKTIINKIEHIKDNSDEEIKVPKIMKLKEKKEPIIIGLNNIGATCYMNATLQSFSNTDKLTEYFLNTYKYDPNDEKKIMSNEYYKVIKNLWDINNKQKCYSPYDFKKN
jgi:ubiquitin C-terminal hydrolase